MMTSQTTARILSQEGASLKPHFREAKNNGAWEAQAPLRLLENCSESLARLMRWSEKPKCRQGDNRHDTQDGQGDGNNAEDPADVGNRASTWIHRACIHFLQVTVPHDPSRDCSEDAAENEA